MYSVESQLTFRRNISPTSSRSKNKTNRALLSTCIHPGFLLDLLFNPEDGGDIFLRLSTDYTALYPRK
jgi:hypothetical protein